MKHYLIKNNNNNGPPGTQYACTQINRTILLILRYILYYYGCSTSKWIILFVSRMDALQNILIYHYCFESFFVHNGLYIKHKLFANGSVDRRYAWHTKQDEFPPKCESRELTYTHIVWNCFPGSRPFQIEAYQIFTHLRKILKWFRYDVR